MRRFLFKEFMNAVKMVAIKALGDWEIEVLGVPFGSPDNRDAHGEFFDASTELHLDKFPAPPVVYYHGFSGNNRGVSEMKSPEYIGKTVGIDKRLDGVWYRVILDKSKAFARKVWEAAQRGIAFASSGTVPHLSRRGENGHIAEWVVAELSLVDGNKNENREMASRDAVAIPVLRSIYKQANLNWPDGLEVLSQEASARGAADESDNPKSTQLQRTKGMKMTEKVLTEADLDLARAEERKSLLAEQEAERVAAKEIKDGQDEAVKTALAKRDEEDAEAKKKLEETEAEGAEGEEAEIIKARRLKDNPDEDVTGKNVNFAKYASLWKFDGLEPGDHALMNQIIVAGGKERVSNDSMKALAVKVLEDKDEDRVFSSTKMAMKMAGVSMKVADALNQSDLTGFGEEWVGILQSSDLWRRILLEAKLVAMLPTIEVPQGSESVLIPLQSTPPTFFKVAQASAQDSNPGPITLTVKTSKMATDNQSLPVTKIGAATNYTGELVEDSLIPWVAELREAIVTEGQEVLESMVIDGDTDETITTNINTIGGTPAGDEAYLSFNGFRKLALVTNTANSRDGGALTDTDYLETLKLMGIAGKNAKQKDKIAFILDLWTEWKTLELVQVKTKDVFSAPTIENGSLTGLWGYKIFGSANMHRANQDTTFGLKANTDGKTDLTTPANNTKGAILAVRWDQWRLGWKRRMTIEVERVPRADASEITALMRVGLINRDTEASAISYNISV